MTTTTEQGPFAGWVILELLGHRRLAGWMQEVQIAGAGFLRIDVPADTPDGTMTQMYPPGSVYAITPTTEEIARQVAKGCQPEPVHPWTLRALTAPPDDSEEYDGDDEPGPF